MTKKELADALATFIKDTVAAGKGAPAPHVAILPELAKTMVCYHLLEEET